MGKSILNEVRETMKSFPTLTEALSFNETDAVDGVENIEGVEPNIEDVAPIVEQNQNTVDQIRKMALQGLVGLVDNVSNPNYEILKKVWQLCEKKPDNGKKADFVEPQI